VREILSKVAASELCSKPNTNNLPYIAEVVQRCKLELARKKLIQAQEKLIRNTQDNNEYNSYNQNNDSNANSRKSTPNKNNTNVTKINKLFMENEERKRMTQS
jgi:hypothetical protein